MDDDIFWKILAIVGVVVGLAVLVMYFDRSPPCLEYAVDNNRFVCSGWSSIYVSCEHPKTCIRWSDR